MIKKENSCEEDINRQKSAVDIAIIGMACRFPDSNDYEEFWSNIEKGNSSIREIPQNRWDWRKYWGDPQTEKNKSNSRWGGFINDIDKFDAEFFGFSPRELETMDPQQRIMIELVWSCFEDAGICPSNVSGEKIGNYIGVLGGSDYKELQERHKEQVEMYHSTGTAMSVTANHISNYFNLKGPSIPLDAACSSSLIAIHLAAQALQLGECSMAFAGGINAILTPTRYISYSKTGMLSPTGSCKTFDEGADGYVRGEGGGVILLKPLAKAIKDGDIIHGVLKGSAENHSGKTYTLTYPDANAQADVILEAQKRANIDLGSIGYIELHGTGTPKGDPIEFEGLMKAFSTSKINSSAYGEKNFCGLGTVKTNIGHLESAAGIAGVIKVLLSLKNKALPGMQNFKKLNHRISINDTPFYIVDQLKKWTPIAKKNGIVLPRRAGVSSFGFGGTNAHVILEEAPNNLTSQVAKVSVSPYLICLSAKTEDALRRMKINLHNWLKKHRSEVNIYDLSATLLLGREAFDVRAAFIVKDLADLEKKLGENIKEEDVDNYLTNDIRKTIKKKIHFKKYIYEKQFENKIKYNKKIRILAKLYVAGHNLNWKNVFGFEKVRKLNLPTYPFIRERYWISGNVNENGDLIKNCGIIHPLIQQNTSTLLKQEFSTNFVGSEFFFRDHIINGQQILPGAAYLEMAYVASKLAIDEEILQHKIIHLKNIVWSAPLIMEDKPIELRTEIFQEHGKDLFFQINSINKKNSRILHSKGNIVFA